mmetsp:Transcript_172654/g.553300  ORF Transcript_172654/g.553300 Transcript_172654/m.553300 type:complete len:384 (+) Transcript_172654:2027-3178(+)
MGVLGLALGGTLGWRTTEVDEEVLQLGLGQHCILPTGAAHGCVERGLDLTLEHLPVVAPGAAQDLCLLARELLVLQLDELAHVAVTLPAVHGVAVQQLRRRHTPRRAASDAARSKAERVLRVGTVVIGGGQGCLLYGTFLRNGIQSFKDRHGRGTYHGRILLLLAPILRKGRDLGPVRHVRVNLGLDLSQLAATDVLLVFDMARRPRIASRQDFRREGTQLLLPQLLVLHELAALLRDPLLVQGLVRGVATVLPLFRGSGARRLRRRGRDRCARASPGLPRRRALAHLAARPVAGDGEGRRARGRHGRRCQSLFDRRSCRLIRRHRDGSDSGVRGHADTHDAHITVHFDAAHHVADVRVQIDAAHGQWLVVGGLWLFKHRRLR